jgi:hypothetical protein
LAFTLDGLTDEVIEESYLWVQNNRLRVQ